MSSPGFLSLNLEVLKQNHPALFQVLAEKVEKKTVHVVSLKNTKKLLENFKTQRIRMALFLGMGDGEALSTFYGKLKESPIIFVFVEKSWDVFFSVLKSLDISELLKNKKCYWFIGLRSQEYYLNFFRFLSSEVNVMAAAQVVQFPLYQPQEAEDFLYYEEIKKQFCQAVYKRLEWAPNEDNYIGLKNTLDNYKVVSQLPHFEKLRGQLKGIPGVVVAAGPSLDFSVEALKDFQNKSVIFSCDASLKILLSHGIIPDFVSCIERVAETRHFFESLPELPDTWLVTQPMMYRESLSSYTGPVCLLNRAYSYLRWIFPEAEIHELGLSASHMAYYALQLLGCSPILLFGQDLSFDTIRAETHARGVDKKTNIRDTQILEKIRNSLQVTEDYQVLGNDGTKKKSSPKFRQFLSDYELMISQYGVKTFNVITKEYGAKIQGAERIDPQEVKEEFKLNTAKPNLKSFKENLKKDNSSESREEFLSRISLAQQFLKEEYPHFILEMLDLLSSFEYFEHQNGAALDQLFVEIESREKIFFEKNISFFALFSPFTSQYKIDCSFKINDLTEVPDDELWIHLLIEIRNYYKDTLYWINRLASLFEKTLKNL